MEPREETISVGGVDVHVWIGGQGDPLLVLHGAGGNRGFTRWLPAGGGALHGVGAHASGLRRARATRTGWRRVDDLARFYLWFIEAAGLGRPHLLGHSIGGWTAAEMAAMSPRRDRPARAGGARRAQARDRRDPRHLLLPGRRSSASMTVHDPKTIPEWDELFGRPPTPAEMEIADAQPGDDGAPDVEALHAQSAARALPAARDEPGADRVGPRGPHRARRVRRAVPAAAAERDAVACSRAAATCRPSSSPTPFARLVIDFLGRGASR